MILYRTWILAFATILYISGSSVSSAYCQESLQEDDLATAITRARRLAREISTTSGVPGMTFAIGVDGKIIWEEGFGVADIEQNMPATSLTKYRVGSVAKSFAAAAVGKLVQTGQLDLDAQVQQYVPGFPLKRWPITTRQVAGHLAGIRHYRGEEFLSSRPYDSVIEGLDIFNNDTLLFEPGSDYNYSTYGFNLVSAVVEGASGEEFLSFMRSAVFDPMEMSQTLADKNRQLIRHRSGFYERAGEEWANAPYVDNSYKWAGGGYLSTASDMVRFGMAMLTDEPLDTATVRLLWTSQSKTNGELTGYGIGFSVSEDFDGRRVIGHGGGSIGGNAELMILPEYGLVLASAANAVAPIHYNELWAMALPFIEDGRERKGGVPGSFLGSFGCVRVTRDGPEDMSLNLIEGDGTTLGWTTMGDQHSRIIDAWTETGTLRLVAISSSGWIGNIVLRESNEGIAGAWNRDQLTCARTGTSGNSGDEQ